MDNLETEVIKTKLKEDNDYQLKNISSQLLTPYVFIDIIDEKSNVVIKHQINVF